MATRYVIYGAGAIGAAVGAHLWRTDHSVLLVGRAAHVNRIREAGLSLVTPEETFVLHVPATIDLRETGVQPGDVILLCVKSQDTETALREVREAGADPKSVPIFCLQNGITNEDRALRLFENVHGVMLNVPGVYLEPGVVSNPIRGNAGFMDIGRYPVGTDDVTQRTVSDLIKAGYAVNAHPRVMEAKRAKFLGNLGTSLGANTDGAGDSAPFLREVRREGENCLIAAGLTFEDPDEFNARVARSRGETAMAPGQRNLGSTWQSLMFGATSLETDFLNGEVVRMGRLHGVPTPHNAVLQETVARMHASGSRPGRFTVADLEGFLASRG